MKKYYFSDYVEEKDLVQDIADNEFLILLDTCLCYCNTFSFDIVDLTRRMSHPRIMVLNPFELTGIDWGKYQSIWRLYGFHHVQDYCIRYFFRYNQQTYKILTKMFKSLFSFPKADEYTTIENLTFFRPDMTVFFCTETHEGDALLFVKETENANHLLSMGIWKEITTSIGSLLCD